MRPQRSEGDEALTYLIGHVDGTMAMAARIERLNARAQQRLIVSRSHDAAVRPTTVRDADHNSYLG